MNIGIVIPIFNQLKYTQSCLASLRETTKPDVRVTFVNNGSTDGTTEFLASCSAVTVINNPENRGCAAAWNQGVNASRAEWIVILNNDVLLTPGWLEGLVAFAEENRFDIVTPAIREGELNYDLDAYARQFIESTAKAARLGVANGICFMVHRRVFEKIGLFDENFHIGQFEDSDFFRRSQQAGFKLGTTGRAFIHHFGSVTQDCIRRNPSTQPYETENRLYFRKKWKSNWFSRHWERYKNQKQSAAWRSQELQQFGHTLMEKWRGGKLEYH